MGSFRFRNSIRIAPGIRLNLNARSASLSAGIPGAHVTYSSKARRTTSVGVPGAGMSYRATKRVGWLAAVIRALR